MSKEMRFRFRSAWQCAPPRKRAGRGAGFDHAHRVGAGPPAPTTPPLDSMIKGSLRATRS
jgi:hypothetical protein